MAKIGEFDLATASDTALDCIEKGIADERERRKGLPERVVFFVGMSCGAQERFYDLDQALAHFKKRLADDVARNKDADFYRNCKSTSVVLQWTIERYEPAEA